MMSGPVGAPLWVFGLGAILILGVVVLVVILTSRS
jgi:hypothetical protein